LFLYILVASTPTGGQRGAPNDTTSFAEAVEPFDPNTFLGFQNAVDHAWSPRVVTKGTVTTGEARHKSTSRDSLELV
jgi:hypothetical protein